MVAFFKALGMGLLYVVTLPLTLVALAFGIVYCIILLVVLSIKALVSFFGGRSIFRDLEEDVLADKIYAANFVAASPVSVSQQNQEQEATDWEEKDEE